LASDTTRAGAPRAAVPRAAAPREARRAPRASLAALRRRD
jgi:hypothetical protein